jgi:hypothetical protein
LFAALTVPSKNSFEVMKVLNFVMFEPKHEDGKIHSLNDEDWTKIMNFFYPGFDPEEPWKIENTDNF